MGRRGNGGWMGGARTCCVLGVIRGLRRGLSLICCGSSADAISSSFGKGIFFPKITTYDIGLTTNYWLDGIPVSPISHEECTFILHVPSFCALDLFFGTWTAWGDD